MDVMDTESEFHRIRHFSEISRILKIRSCRIGNFWSLSNSTKNFI